MESNEHDAKPFVRVFSTQSCPWCIKAKQFLSDNNIEFESLDVGSDAVARQELLELTNQMGVPVLDIGGSIVIGFDVQKIASLLKIDLDN